MKWLRVIPIATFLFAYSVMAQDDLTPMPTSSPTPIPTATPEMPRMVGVIAPIWGNAAPGWLLCDGSTISGEDYPYLVQEVGLIPEVGDDSIHTGMYFLPDCSSRVIVGGGFGEGLLPVNPGGRLEWQIPAVADGEEPQARSIAGLGVNYYIWSGSTGEEPEPMPTPLPDIYSYGTISVGESEVPTAIDMSISAGEFAIVLVLLAIGALLAIQIVQRKS